MGEEGEEKEGEVEVEVAKVGLFAEGGEEPRKSSPTVGLVAMAVVEEMGKAEEGGRRPPPLDPTGPPPIAPAWVVPPPPPPAATRERCSVGAHPASPTSSTAVYTLPMYSNRASPEASKSGGVRVPSEYSPLFHREEDQKVPRR